MSNLQQEIGALSQAETMDLLDMIWESIEADIPSLTAGQSLELDFRVARYQENPSDVIPWEQVWADLLKKQ